MKRLISWIVCFVMLFSLFACAKAPSQSKTNAELYRAAIVDAMVADQDEIQPLVSLTKDDKLSRVNDSGEVLLLSWHKYPTSYPAGETIQNSWGEIWTFTDLEILAWFNSSNNKICSDWETRLEQLIGLPIDANYTHFTAMWTDIDNVIRPAYVTDVTKSAMKTAFETAPDPTYKEWFDGNILGSYFDGAYPWTRLGYTYDWADNGQEYGLSEFLIKKNSSCRVTFTKSLEQFVGWLVDGGK